MAVAPVADSWGAVGAWGDEPPPSPAAAATTAAPQPLLPSPSAAAAAAVSEPTTLSVAPPPSPHDTIRFPAFAISTFDEDDEGSDGGGDSDSDGSTDGGAGSGKLGDEAQRWRRYEEWRAAAGDDDAALEAPSAVDGDEGGEEEEEEEGEDDGGGAAAGGAAAGKATLGGWAGPGSDVVVTAAGPRSGWAGGAGSAAAGGRASRAQTGEPRRTRNAAPVARGRAHGGGGDEYEALPAETRYMLRWQAWLKRAGQPCIRYAYGLAPRWPVPPGDILVGGAGVPPCPCGRRRTFELQILPAVLSLLAVDEHVVETDEGVKEGGPLAPPQATASAASLTEATIAADSARRSAAAADVRGSGAGGPSRAAPRLLLGGGMDFSTVLVFSCPDSCAESSSEVAVVVPNR